MMQSDRTEMLNIVARRRWDPMSMSRVEDFRLRREGEWEAKILGDVRRGLSPYCLEPKSRRVSFVETEADFDLAATPFYYQAQFQHAKKLLLVPYEEVIQQSEQLTTSFTPVMVYSVGRSGTTLLSRMLGQSPRCVSLSEPDVYTNLQQQGMEGEEAVALLRAVTKFHFQPRADQPATHLVLKFRGMCTELAPMMRAAFPNVVDLFLYRDAEAYVTSSMRAFSYFLSPLWGIRRLHNLVITRPVLTQLLHVSRTEMTRFFPLTAGYTPRELCRLGPVGMLTIAWLSMMHRAWQMAEEGRPLPSLRYETLKENPRRAAQVIFERCGLPESDVELALTALSADSQRGSVVGRERQSKYELSGRDRQTIRDVLARHPVINRPDYELPAGI